MNKTKNDMLRNIPSVDEVLRSSLCAPLLEAYGRDFTSSEIRRVLAVSRAKINSSYEATDTPVLSEIVSLVDQSLATLTSSKIRSVLNLTGVVLHTNLGRAPLPEEALMAMRDVAGATNLEFDLQKGRRGDRDRLVKEWICRLTGAEASTVVNNNAAAVLLTLNTFANRKEVPVSRGELVEIGGEFRIPDVMRRAGSKLVEVGTTNRTHERDYRESIGTRTGMIMKVHTSNYVVNGFTSEVSLSVLAGIARESSIPLTVDLGSGTLVDMSRWGLPQEPTVSQTLSVGADLVTFSGDKLLGGPQCGIIAGRGELISRIKKNPLRRALRVDKFTLAALGAVLPLYAHPEKLPYRLPTYNYLTKTASQIRRVAENLLPTISTMLGQLAEVSVEECSSQIGSGALPVETLPSAALLLQPKDTRSRAPEKLALSLRELPVPVVGRVREGAVWLDLRCLDSEQLLLEQLAHLSECGVHS